MQFDNIFQTNRTKISLTLSADRHRSISLIENTQLYVKPIFKDIHIHDNQKIIIFSAPGATGKSALAKYIAYTFKGIYWDLSKIKLGENSLHGSLMRALRPDGFTKFVSALSNGETMLVVDAFDEADMISGRSSLEFLLSDLAMISRDSKECCIVLLARTETARFIAHSLKENSVQYSHFEINFFSAAQRKEFVIKVLEHSGKSVNQAINTCIEMLFSNIERKLDRNIVTSFLGYAPVLEAIAKAIETETNHGRMISRLATPDDTSLDGSTIIDNIMRDLLDREQSKVINAFKERCTSKFPNFINWDNLYNTDEQLVRLSCYVAFGEVSYDDYHIGALDHGMEDEYADTVSTFIKEHPFLLFRETKNGEPAVDFTGPAFRDYTLSRVIQKSDFEFLADGYFNIESNNNMTRFPSSLFFDFYSIFSKNNMISHHLGYLYESFKSKEFSGGKVHFNIQQAGSDCYADFSITDTKSGTTRTASLNVSITDKCFFINNISNATISLSCNIYIGSKNDTARIANSEIYTNNIIFNSNHIRIEAYKSEKCYIVSNNDPLNSSGMRLEYEIYTDNDENIKIHFPNILRNSTLKKYAFEVDSAATIEIEKFSHALRSILIYFRSHGKDAPARHRDLIDNVVLSHSTVKTIVFRFLIHFGSIFIDPQESALYKMDLKKMGELEISMACISQGMTHKLSTAYNAFTKWHIDHTD